MKSGNRTPSMRLLPVVMIVGLFVLGLKAMGIAFTATAAETPAPKEATGAPAELAKPTPVAPDPTVAINAAMPLQPKTAEGADTITGPQSDLPPDLMSAGVSPAEMDVLSALADRRNTLDDRERALQTKASLIDAAEQRVDSKIADLKAIQDQIEKLLGQRDEKELAQIDSLVKIYSSMKPKDAARIMASLDDNVRKDVAGRMKADALAQVMASLPADVAQKLTVELAERYRLPDETKKAADAAVNTPAPAAAAPATPGTTSSETTAVPAANASAPQSPQAALPQAQQVASLQPPAAAPAPAAPAKQSPANATPASAPAQPTQQVASAPQAPKAAPAKAAAPAAAPQTSNAAPAGAAKPSQ